uniref:Uncharacterized protein n=1 Tax=Amphimedon queenslandica TaxID=400682 RepID=A0A1X7VIW4_AMPQE
MQEAERHDFYYSLIFVFAPFRVESALVIEGGTMDEAFRCHREASIRGIKNHFNQLQISLEADRNLKKILITEIKPISLKKLLDKKEDDEPQLPCEIMEAVADTADVHIIVPNLRLEQRGAMPNVDQKRLIDEI